MGRKFNELDDLVLQLKGLVLVRKLLQARGTEVGELDADIVRVREQLARKVQLVG